MRHICPFCGRAFDFGRKGVYPKHTPERWVRGEECRASKQYVQDVEAQIKLEATSVREVSTDKRMRPSWEE